MATVPHFLEENLKWLARVSNSQKLNQNPVAFYFPA